MKAENWFQLRIVGVTIIARLRPGIFNPGTLALTNGTVSGNTAPQIGGGHTRLRLRSSCS
jgi:hypothetical protein